LLSGRAAAIGRVVGAGSRTGFAAGRDSAVGRVVAGFASDRGAGLFSFASRVVAAGCCVAGTDLAVTTGRASFAFTGLAAGTEAEGFAKAACAGVA
jgi:hypothetical protein